MRRLAAWSIVLVPLVVRLGAHEGSEQLRVEAPPRPLILTIPDVTEPRSRRLGLLTLVPTTQPGEVVKVMVPIGDLATRAAHGLSSARQRRGERKVREAVQRELDAFRARQQEPGPVK